MKLNRITILTLIWVVLTSSIINGQDNRTIQTQVADVLALFPAGDNQQATRLFKEMMNLNDEGLMMVTDRVLPNGKQEGIGPRFAVSLLTHHAATKEEKVRIEKIYLSSLSKSKDTEVKAYFIDNLKLIGSNNSVKPLAEQITDKALSNQAISALVSIGTPEAREALLNALNNNAHSHAPARLIKALGELKHLPALPAITKFASGEDTRLKKPALWSMALMADAGSLDVLLQQAKNVNFKNDPGEATHALIEYMHQLSGKGNNPLVINISKAILAGTMEASQQHFRLAALKAMAKADPAASLKVLIQELTRFDPLYQQEVIKIGAPYATHSAATRVWLKEYKKASGSTQGKILSMLAGANRNDAFIEATLLPALTSKNPQTRMVAAEEIAYSRNEKFKPYLVDYLLKATDANEIHTGKIALLRVMDEKAAELLVQKFDSAPPKNKAAILEILAARRAVESFDIAFKNTASKDTIIQNAAYAALPYLSSGKNTTDLLSLLAQSKNDKHTGILQQALIASLDDQAINPVNEAYTKDKSKILPLLPYVNDKDALNKVTTSFNNGNNDKEKAAAFEALLVWQNHEAARTLLNIRKDKNQKKYHERAFNAFISQVGKSSWPDDQKLLMFDEIMTLTTTTSEKVAVIRAVGNLRTFLSLMFVSRYLDEKDLNTAASRSVMQIALPTSDARPGLTGIEVRNTLQKILDKLQGQDSQYEVIDIQTYLGNLPYTKGFESIFNGKDLSGWQGLVENPILRAKMSKEVLAMKQKEANIKSLESWSVKEGAIYFTGDGANLCTVRPYGDFEMIVDWKISRDGDSGIYLRGSPQVQIWDPTGKEEAAKVGSGGLYNNKTGRSTPLVLADNPIGEWNTFNIKMVGDVVTVHLNGVLVVDKVVMENYWDRSIPIFPEEAIELQAHGNELAFRNIYVKELNTKPYALTQSEKEAGFELLFNGKDLNNWVGNKSDYVVEDNVIAIYPKKDSHGNLNTVKEYSDFIFRFEFQLTPGANNGLGIHAPLDGDAAYSGKEIQILDNTAPVYSKLEPYQYHGSVYGLIAAKRDYLKPVGEWNDQEVYVKGDQIKVTLNGTVILDGDLKKATKNGTLDKKEHPGLNKHKGHISFLGHGTVVKFRNIRIKDLSDK